MQPKRQTPRCKECGRKIRGANHRNGEHHVDGKAKREAKGKAA